MRAQLWRTVRTLGMAFILVSAIGALVDDKALGKGLLSNPDLKPQFNSTTRFADVKGVDEAKARLALLCSRVARHFTGYAKQPGPRPQAAS